MSINLTADDPLCIESKEVYTNVWLIVIFSLTLIFDFVAMVCCVLGAKGVYRTQLLHVNLRVSLCSVSIALMVRACLTAFRCIRYLVRAVTVTNPCGFLDLTSFCKTYSGLHSWPYDAVMYTMPLITAERMLALVASAHYETWAYPRLAFLINLLPWIYGGILFYGKLQASIVNVVPVTYCSSYALTAYNTFFVVELFNDPFFIVPFSCLCVDIALRLICKYLINKFLRDECHEHSLSHRFQLNEVFRTTKIAIPASLAFCLLNITSNFVVGLPLVLRLVHNAHEFSLIKEFSGLTTMPVYTIIYGTLLYWYNLRPVETRHRCCYNRQISPTVSTEETARQKLRNETETYFQIYSARW